MPDYLQLIENPPSPTVRWTSCSIVIFSLLIIIWSFIGKIDIHVISQGKIISNGRSKIIQPLETGRIKAIYVNEGQIVNKGDKLTNIEVIGAEEIYLQNESDLISSFINYQIGHSVIIAMSSTSFNFEWLNELPHNGKKYIISDMKTTYIKQNHEGEKIALSIYQSWINKIRKLTERKKQIESEMLATKEEIKSLSFSISLESNKLNDYQKLNSKNYLSHHELINLKDKISKLNHQCEITKSKYNELSYKNNEIDNEMEINTQEVLRNAIEMKRNADNEIKKLIIEMIKNKKRYQTTTLTSPVDGRVQQLSVNTINGVVTTATPLMVIVPNDSPYEIEIMIENKDIGFIRENQSVIVKIDSFPYTRYGYLTGKIKSISYDSVKDDDKGYVFPAIVNLVNNKIIINGESVNLKAGMTVTSEIKTGERKVIDYVISPLQTKIDESFWER
ncbi:HlyD family type I secretion periplasmic adaptor subunit [Xenorhabdus sp. TS4]|uniref:HlyD family type I secretion periplasmic adaptor subunit n=1 Tax=Xenorhabdus sp. TS4 TaxID=1873483 RepID=UPI00165710D4|nr:HlyD family type I secretion periplasmic adaptor subunit [Xenorhabdus sp. TS4]MBC8950595.1 hemolysin D [Xenorhabdus sp. TS4]